MKLSKAQKRYLAKAITIGAWANAGVFFSIWRPGRSQTGRALQRRGLVEPFTPSHHWPYCLTEAAANVWRAIDFAERCELLKAVKS